MVEQFLYWILTGITGGLAIIVWFAFKSWKRAVGDNFREIGIKLDKFIETISGIANENTRLNTELNAINQNLQETKSRLNGYANRLHQVEMEHSKNHR